MNNINLYSRKLARGWCWTTGLCQISDRDSCCGCLIRTLREWWDPEQCQSGEASDWSMPHIPGSDWLVVVTCDDEIQSSQARRDNNTRAVPASDWSIAHHPRLWLAGGGDMWWCDAIITQQECGWRKTDAFSASMVTLWSLWSSDTGLGACVRLMESSKQF